MIDRRSEMPTIQRIGKPRRGPDPASIVVVFIVVFLVVAVAKPWEFGRPGPSSPVTAIGTPRPSAIPSASVAPTGPTPSPSAPADAPVPSPTPNGLELASWQPEVASATRDHDAWGVRAFTDSPTGGPTLAETWVAAQQSARNAGDPCTAPHSQAIWLTTSAQRPIVAIGVTTPHQDAVLDVRIWLGGDMRYVPTTGVALPGEGTELVFLPPASLSADRTWRPGSYRIDVLTSACIVTIQLDIRGDVAANAPALPFANLDDTTITNDSAMWPVGAFALTASRASGPLITMTAFLGQPIQGKVDARTAWTGLSTAAPGDLGQFETPLEGASILGVDLAAVTVDTAVLSEIAPLAVRLSTQGEVITVRGSGDTSGHVVVAFRQPETGFGAGTYRIDATWHAGAVEDRASWLLDVYPSADGSLSPLIDAVRSAATADSGVREWGIAPELSQATTSQQPNTAPLDPAKLGDTCRGGQLLGPQRVISAEHADAPVSGVSVSRLFTGGSSIRIDSEAAIDPFPGRVLVAPLHTPTWPAGYYELAFTGASKPEHLVFCVGVVGASSVVVPPGAEDLQTYLDQLTGTTPPR